MQLRGSASNISLPSGIALARYLLYFFAPLVFALVVVFFVQNFPRPWIGAAMAVEADSWVITYVDWGSLAWEAGIKPGDKVLSANGRSPGEVAARKTYLSATKVSELTTLSAAGEQRVASLSGARASAAAKLEATAPLVMALVFWLSGLFTLLKRPNRLVALLLCLLTLFIALGTGTIAAAERNVWGAVEVQVVAFILIPWLFLHLLLLFPEKKWLLQRSALFPAVLYLPALAMLVPYVSFGRDGSPFYPWFRAAVLGNLTVGVLLGMASLVHSYLRSMSVHVRQQIKVLAVATCAGILPFVFLSAAPDVVLGHTLLPANFTALGAAAMPIALIYTIVRYRLMDIDLVIRRGLVYGSLMAAMLAIYASLVVVIGLMIPWPAATERVLAVMVLSFVFMLAFGPAKQRLEHLVDRTVYKDRYDFKESIRSLGATLLSITDLDALTQFTANSVSDTLGLSGACLLFSAEPGRMTMKAANGIYAADVGRCERLASLANALTEEELFPREAPPTSGAAFIVPLEVRRERIGLLCLGPKVSRVQFTASDISFVFSFMHQASVCMRNTVLAGEAWAHARQAQLAKEQLKEYAESLERTTRSLEQAYLNIAQALVSALESRDPYSKGHSERVAQLSRQIGLELGLHEKDLETLELAAKLHDIGKIGIPDGVLLKPGPLEASERAQVQLHPAKSVEILRFLRFLEDAIPIIEAHHEHFDGRGYPRGLRGPEIALLARILAVADAYVALTAERPYRAHLTHADAIRVLLKGAGRQWDAQVIDALLRSFKG